MNCVGRFGYAGIGIGALLVALSLTCASAQQGAPAASPPANATPAAVPATSAATGVGCTTPRLPTTAGGASVVQATADNLQQKSWQPRGGEIEFTVRSSSKIPEDARIIVCFRWKTTLEGRSNPVEVRPSRLDRSSDGLTLKVTVTVPLMIDPPEGERLEYRLAFVPVADVRILAIVKEKDQDKIGADASTSIGVPHRFIAIVFALATVILALFVLAVVAQRRLTNEEIKKANWPLRIIAMPSGRASLSQLQIVIWTLLVAGAAVYVMAASGELIQISNGTLVLLGIAGAAGIASKAHSEAQAAAAPAAPAGAAVAPAAPAGAAAPAPAATPAIRTPRWSDLLVDESADEDAREIDVARMQMLLFTLIAAVFVAAKVYVSYVIPEIPEGFQILMGISNAVYIGAKVTKKDK